MRLSCNVYCTYPCVPKHNSGGDIFCKFGIIVLVDGLLDEPLAGNGVQKDMLECLSVRVSNGRTISGITLGNTQLTHE